MSKEKEMATKNKILEYRIGSHLYGTNTPTSDEDYNASVNILSLFLAGKYGSGAESLVL